MKTTARQQENSQAIQAKVNKQDSVNSILQRYKDKTTQRQSTEEEELLQGKFETAQKMELDEEEPVQGKFATAQLATEDEEEPLQCKPNNTGLPDNLKSGIENLSGYSMDDVKVHYNSSQPATLQAHAYAQGTDIHIAPGQEKHLPHEAWHVVQQKQGRVKPTMQMKGTVPVNDDAGLEKETGMDEKSTVQKQQAFTTAKETDVFTGKLVIVNKNALKHGKYSKKGIIKFMRAKRHTIVRSGEHYTIALPDNDFLGYKLTRRGVIVTHCGPFGGKKTAQL